MGYFSMNFTLIFVEDETKIELKEISEFYFSIKTGRLYKRYTENQITPYCITYRELLNTFWNWLPKSMQNVIEDQIVNKGLIDSVIESRSVQTIFNSILKNRSQYVS